MASVTTNRGKYAMLATYFRADATYEPTGFSIALVTSAAVVNADANVWADLSAAEIAAGNGYVAGGINLGRNSTDFDVLIEDDVNDRALVQLRDITWTAAGGNLPVSGNGARYAVLMDDDVNKNVIVIFDLGADRVVSDTQSLILRDCEYRLT